MYTLLLAAMLGATDTTAQVRDMAVAPGEILRTSTLGTGPEIVVFIPSIFGGAFGYRHLTAPLAELGYRTIVVEPLGYGSSSHPSRADYSFTAQADRIAAVLDSLGASHAIVIAQSNAVSIALRLSFRRPDQVRGLLLISGGPAETPATPGLKRSLRYGGFLTKLVVTRGKPRGKVRQDLIANSGDTTWVTDAVVESYTEGQAADVHGAIDGLRRMSKTVEPESLAVRMPETRAPVRLLVGSAPHPASVKDDEIARMANALSDFSVELVAGAGQYIHEEQPAVVLEAFTRLVGATVARR